MMTWISDLIAEHPYATATISVVSGLAAWITAKVTAAGLARFCGRQVFRFRRLTVGFKRWRLQREIKWYEDKLAMFESAKPGDYRYKDVQELLPLMRAKLCQLREEVKLLA